MKISLSLFFFLLIFWQLAFSSPSLNLAWGWLLVLVLINFPLSWILALAFLAGFLVDIYSGLPFGLNMLVWSGMILTLCLAARDFFSIERNLLSSLIFITAGFLLFYLFRAAAAIVFSDLFFGEAFSVFISGRFWLYFLSEVALSWIFFFIFNFFHVKKRLHY